MAATLNFGNRQDGPLAVIELTAETTIVGRNPLPELASLLGIGWEYYAVSKEGTLYVGLPWCTKGSRRHFAIRREAGRSGVRYLVRDLGSTCGFMITGASCGSGEEFLLQDRDIIHYGIEFQFCLRC